MLSNLFCRNHGQEKHQGDYEEVRNYSLKNTPVQTLFRADDNRYAEVYQIKRNRFGILIWQRHGRNHMEIVTGFIKNKMSRLDKVLNYLNNQGYS